MNVKIATDTKAEREAPEGDSAAEADDDRVVVMEDLLIEEVSIDGMCGVY